MWRQQRKITSSRANLQRSSARANKKKTASNWYCTHSFAIPNLMDKSLATVKTESRPRARQRTAQPEQENHLLVSTEDRDDRSACPHLQKIVSTLAGP